jgi:hypothetical protein
MTASGCCSASGLPVPRRTRRVSLPSTGDVKAQFLAAMSHEPYAAQRRGGYVDLRARHPRPRTDAARGPGPHPPQPAPPAGSHQQRLNAKIEAGHVSTI